MPLLVLVVAWGLVALWMIVAGVGCFVAVWLTFSPPAFYLRWVGGMATLRGSAADG